MYKDERIHLPNKTISEFNRISKGTRKNNLLKSKISWMNHSELFDAKNPI